MDSDFHILFFAVGAFWFWRSIRSCLALRRVPFLAELPAASLRPWVSVVLMARNAAETIERSVRDLIRQRHVELDVVVVDDRSDDGTAERASRAAPDEERVRVASIREVPDGWLPKVHGLVEGLRRAQGEWVLLLDRPVALETEDVVARAVHHARGERATALSLVPRGRTGWLSPVALSAMVDSLPAMAATNQDRASAQWFSPIQLVKRDALERVSLDDLRMNPLAETAIAQRFRERELRLRTVQAGDEIVVPDRIGTSFVLEALERLFAAIGFQIAILAMALCLYAGIWAAAVYGPFHPNLWGLWAAGGLASQIVPAFLVAQIYRVPWICALFTPLTLPIELGLTAWAMARAKWNRGVTWQGRFFSIDELRAALRGEREIE